MNYRHAFHAGNFADVLKHAVLAAVIAYMKGKPAPFRYIDTHAGRGRYDLAGDEAGRTGEWHDGIGRLIGPNARPLSEGTAHFLAPYLDVVRQWNSEDILRHYPGSPLIARSMLRGQDRLIVNELQPLENEQLRQHMRSDPRAQVMGLDGWQALKALLPPKERRGVVLVDPPFEKPGELGRLVTGLRDAVHRFATGTILLWYPIKDIGPVRQFESDLAHVGAPKLLRLELLIRAPRDRDLLNGCGLAILNPPYVLPDILNAVMPELAAVLAQGPGSQASLQWLTAG